MEVIKGKVISRSQDEVPEKEIEYMTAPVPVRRNKLSFGAVVAVQVLLSLAVGGALLWSRTSDSEAGTLIGEIMRQLLNG